MHIHKFIMGGDFNANHVYWGSRLTTSKGRELFQAQETETKKLSRNFIEIQGDQIQALITNQNI